MKNITTICLIACMISANIFAQTSFYSDKLTEKWSTEKVLDTPESVRFDAENKVLYVSNVNGQPLDKDENGYISKLSLDGKIIEKEWVTDLNAPKGMDIHKGKLYVSDIDKVVKIDIKSGTIEKTYQPDDAMFLNDVAALPNGDIYISDMNKRSLFIIKDDQISEWYHNEDFDHINGLVEVDGKLIAGISNKILEINIEKKSYTVLIENVGGVDGLKPVDENKFVISDWSGNVNIVSVGKDNMLLINSTPDKINAADHEYIADKKLLVIPTFFDNRVVAYELNCGK